MHQLLEGYEPVRCQEGSSRGFPALPRGPLAWSLPGGVSRRSRRSELHQVECRARRRLGCSEPRLGASASQGPDIKPTEDFEAPV